jgi:hypothetical protein
MAAGISDTLWTMEDIAETIEANRPQPGKRGPYKKRARPEPAQLFLMLLRELLTAVD